MFFLCHLNKIFTTKIYIHTYVYMHISVCVCVYIYIYSINVNAIVPFSFPILLTNLFIDHIKVGNGNIYR